MFHGTDLLFAIKTDAYIFKETGWFCRFPKPQKLDKWVMAGEKRQTCWPKLHIETEYKSQLTAILQNRHKSRYWWQEKKKWATDIWPICQRKRPPPLHKTGQVESGWKIHSRDSFIHVSVILYISMYVCIYNFLWMILIPSLWSELLEVRWQSLAKIFWFLCHCEIK